MIGICKIIHRKIKFKKNYNLKLTNKFKIFFDIIFIKYFFKNNYLTKIYFNKI
jgi:hypothetical protein